jgi:hypothetical protein
MYNVALRRVKTPLPWNNNKYYTFLCACARARAGEGMSVRASACASLRTRVFVCGWMWVHERRSVLACL